MSCDSFDIAQPNLGSHASRKREFPCAVRMSPCSTPYILYPSIQCKYPCILVRNNVRSTTVILSSVNSGKHTWAINLTPLTSSQLTCVQTLSVGIWQPSGSFQCLQQSFRSLCTMSLAWQYAMDEKTWALDAFKYLHIHINRYKSSKSQRVPWGSYEERPPCNILQ